MTKIKKTYRLDADLIESMQVEANKRGISATDAIQQAIQQYISVSDSEPYAEPYGSHTLDKAFEALERQLAIKDEQIANLNKALLNAQEQGHTAQVLHGMDKAPVLLETSEAKAPKKERITLGDRIWRFISREGRKDDQE